MPNDNIMPIKMRSRLALIFLSFICIKAYALEPNQLSNPNGAGNASGLVMSNQLLNVDNQNQQLVTPKKVAPQTNNRLANQPDQMQSFLPNVERKPRAKNEFQKFVEKSSDRDLEMFGYDIFKNSSNGMMPIENVPVTSDYAIGPGDELLISVWGQVEANETVIVDRNGTINLPKVGTINVAGVQYANLQAHIKSAVSKVFKNFELNVSLGKLRSIQVYVVGQAEQPGNYTVSSMSTLVNAIFASGGPSNKGSMRHIQLKRNGKLVSDFDMYDLILKGDKSKDVKLLPGDVIYIPAVGPMAAITGSVNVPAIYELNGKENLAALILLSGGLSNVAAGQKVTVERIQNHERRLVDDFVLAKDGLAKLIQDGDLVTVNSISPRFDNAITLKGNVAIPGRHPWRQGIRVSDIIPDRSVLIVNQYWNKQNRINLQSKDDVQHLTSEALKDNIKSNSAEINWDYALVERLNRDDLKTSLHTFNLGKAINDPSDENNLLLEPGDVITIFSKTDIQVPVAKRTKYVTLDGEFVNPGVYQVKAGETLRQVIARVGGVSADGYLLATELTRESARETQQKRLDEMVKKLEDSVQRNSVQNSANRDPLEAANLKLQLESQNALVAKMKEVRATGRLILDIAVDNPRVEDLPEIALEDGDHIYVPPIPSTVTVMGQVYNQNTFLFSRGQTVADYLNKAGGPTRDADKDDIYLVRADGVVMSKRQNSYLFGTVSSSFNSRQIGPGDTLVIPERLDKYNLTKDLKDWSQIFYQFSLGIAAMKTLGVF